jgi:hypothetical protein
VLVHVRHALQKIVKYAVHLARQCETLLNVLLGAFGASYRIEIGMSLQRKMVAHFKCKTVEIICSIDPTNMLLGCTSGNAYHGFLCCRPFLVIIAKQLV